MHTNRLGGIQYPGLGANYPLHFNAEVVLKATNVDGVYDDDPRRNPNARLHDTLTYHEQQLKEVAIYLKYLSVNAVVVFNLTKAGNIAKAIKGESVGTLIGGTWNSTVATA
ncbi:uridylate kinase-like [Hibiscus syriacus]|uniref:uridylate kinase-like n=1 Tax=Hibiscus syriacus TaxID=106335 RepID=UPI001920BAB3|nr:uridylate kinase-like [Hibiscus syriacus]